MSPVLPRQVRRSNRRAIGASGFTLIEVLVVVAIIALLIAILMPSLAKAREMSRRSACLSNLHQQAVGMSAYAAEHKGRLPRRGWYAYYLKEEKGNHEPYVGGVPAGQENVPEPINFGALYGKYVGINLDIYFCPSLIKPMREHPLWNTYGTHTFLDPDVELTFGGYLYAAPLTPGFSPRVDGKSFYPEEQWYGSPQGPAYQSWVNGSYGKFYAKWVEDEKPKSWKPGPIQALQSDQIIGGAGSTLVTASHKDGLCVLYSDFHAKFVNDNSAHLLRDSSPTSGPGGAPKLYEMWDYFSRNY